MPRWTWLPLALWALVVRAEFKDVALLPFCPGECKRPDRLYPDEHVWMNYNATSSLIPRATPDGVHPWPYKMAPGWPTDPTKQCNESLWPNPCFEYTTTQRATWWDDYAGQPALPTNSWFTDLFSSTPVSAFPRVFAWPVMQLPYSVIAALDGFSITLPVYQVATNGGLPGIAGDIPQDAKTFIAPEIAAVGVDRIAILRPAGSPSLQRRIKRYDRNTLGVYMAYEGSGTQRIDYHLFKGSPFITSIFRGYTPELAFSSFVLQSINGVPCNCGCSGVKGVVVKGGVLRYTIEIYGNNEHWYTYVLYSNTELSPTVNIKGQVLSVSEGVCSTQCILRIGVSELRRLVKITGASQFSPRWTSLTEQGGLLKVDVSTLDSYANTFPVLGNNNNTVSFLYADDKLRMRFSWETQCMVPGCSPSDLLTLALPHHQGLMDGMASTPQVKVPTVQYPITVGVAVAYAGNIWEVDYPVSTTLSPAMAAAVNAHLGGSTPPTPPAPPSPTPTPTPTPTP
eukprot:Sspe_Gene.102916::Locus_78757_Transcript_1_1_Confidence_1.000_Length_1565::g.102916::m.102916